jgi:DNA-binding LytR/AlgR family response regulator
VINLNDNILAVKSSLRVYLIDQASIIFIYADNNYSHIVMKDRELRIKRSLSKIFKELNQSIFFMAHRTNIINLKHVKYVDKSEFSGYEVFFTTTTKVAMMSKAAYHKFMTIVFHYNNQEGE